MATFIFLEQWTERGIAAVRDTVDRTEVAERQMERFGGRLKDVYWTVGPYDAVAIAEFPDVESASAYALTAASGGNFRTVTLRAFDRDEMRSVLGRME
jgi:uncharacterized protein with GYD domain